MLPTVAAGGSPATGAVAMLMLELGQGVVLVVAATFGARLITSSCLRGFRKAVEIALG